jgi:hypothetical protein
MTAGDSDSIRGMMNEHPVAAEGHRLGRPDGAVPPVRGSQWRQHQVGVYESNVVAFGALMAIAFAHVITVWGYGALYWGDQGRWLHEVDRFAAGQVVYRDFHWGFPPLSMWLLGTYARVFGSDLTPIWIATSAVFMGIAMLYYFYIAHLVERRLALTTAIAGLVLAIVYANTAGVPLPQGMYIPAAPIGFLFLLGGILLAIRSIQRPSTGLGILLGLTCGACILTKQDFWPPAAYLITVSAGMTLSNAQCKGQRVVVASTVAAFLTSIAVGAVWIVVQSGAGALVGVLGGFGHVAEYGGSGLPSWERLTIEVVACALLGGGLTVLLLLGGAISRSTAKWPLILTAVIALAGVTLHVGMGFRLASSLDKTGPLPFMARFVASIARNDAPLLRLLLGFSRDRLLQHLLPALLPGIVLLVLLVGWRRLCHRPLFRPLLLLLGLCLTARIRRLFGGVEWYHFLLELPVYVLVVQLLVAEQRERVSACLIVFLTVLTITVGGYSHWNYGRGPLTRRENWVPVLTARGVYYMPPNQANDYRLLISLLWQIDPTGTRPLFAFGDTGGFNYLSGRNNPTPLTQGFRLSNADPEEVVTALIHQVPPEIHLDNAMVMSATDPATTPNLSRWETPAVRGVHARVDRPYFNQVLSHCTRAGEVPKQQAYLTVYDCGR